MAGVGNIWQSYDSWKKFKIAKAFLCLDLALVRVKYEKIVQ